MCQLLLSLIVGHKNNYQKYMPFMSVQWGANQWNREVQIWACEVHHVGQIFSVAVVSQLILN